jgi:hypothetical protein
LVIQGSAAAVRQSFFSIAASTKMRSTSGPSGRAALAAQ